MYLKEITAWLFEQSYEFDFRGSGDCEVTGFASLDSYSPGKITWIKKQGNYEKLEDPASVTAAVVQAGLQVSIPNQIICPNSKEVFFAILHHFWGKENQRGLIGTGTYISSEAKIDPTASIGCNCSIQGHVTVGRNTVIENNVSIINGVTIGEDCLIHSGAVIGSDGFGFAFDEKGIAVKVEHFGGVSIGNRVEIGANTCIDRGTIDDTVLQDDVKVDNLVHIAHNVVVMKGAVVIAGAIICGSVKLGENSYIAPGGIVKNQLGVGNNAFVGLGAVVTKPVEANSVVAGVPAKEIRKVKAGDK